jgi:hypothetical protein
MTQESLTFWGGDRSIEAVWGLASFLALDLNKKAIARVGYS